MPYVVGLTGGIGSGKSEATRAFAALNVPVADADEAAHAVTVAGAPGHRAVVAAFGSAAQAPDGGLDRAWLRKTVFADAAARRTLEEALHPLIALHLDGEIRRWSAPYGILSVPLLLERGNLLRRVARILVVDCPEPVQIERVMARSGLTANEVEAIMATQLSRAERLARADDVIDNGGARAALAPQVARLDARYRELAAAQAALEPDCASPQNGAQPRDGQAFP
jgi:dephospho-CoA kinase